jgi:hypothetical protein
MTGLPLSVVGTFGRGRVVVFDERAGENLFRRSRSDHLAAV